MSKSTLPLDDDDVTLVGHEIGLSSQKSTSFTSNRAPSPMERDIIKQRISLSNQRSTGYYMRILEAKRWVMDLEEMMTLEARERAILQGSLSALRYLPDEVLSIIFEIYVLQLNGSPWNLTKVSTWFRQVALASHSLWTRIELLEQSDPSLTHEDGSGREVCSNFPQLQAALARSGVARIDLKFTNFDKDMMHAVIKERGRWASFHLGNLNYDHALVQRLFTETQTPAPLEKVTLEGFVHRYYVRQWLDYAQPVFLSLKNPFELEGLLGSLWSRRLRELEILHLQLSFRLTGILRMTAPQLTHLSLSHIHGDFMAVPITFPKLLELHLCDIHAWWKFQAPGVRLLTLSPVDILPETTVVAYPNLESLLFNAQVSTPARSSIFAPLLLSLTLQHVQLNPECILLSIVPGCFQLSAAMHLQRLYIQNCTLQFREFVDSLHTLTSLQELHITNTTLPISFYKAFGTGTAARRNGMICPLLRTMVIDCTQCRAPMVKDAFIETFMDVVKARLTVMSQLCIYWPQKMKSPPTYFV